MRSHSTIDSPDYRRRAMQCFSAAHDPDTTGEVRLRLLTMRTGLLQLADAQDWLNGQRVPVCA
jgi:hypothetical protein